MKQRESRVLRGKLSSRYKTKGKSSFKIYALRGKLSNIYETKEKSSFKYTYCAKNYLENEVNDSLEN